MRNYLDYDFVKDLNDKEFLNGMSLFDKKLYYIILGDTKGVNNGEWDEALAQSIIEEAYRFDVSIETEYWDDSVFKEYDPNMTKESFSELPYEEQEEIVRDVLDKKGFETIIIDDTDRSAEEMVYQRIQ